MNCRGDDDIDANGRDRRSGRPVTCAMRGLNACEWLGPDQRITSGPAATAAAFKGRIHGCTRPAREMSDFPLAPRAPSIHGTKRICPSDDPMSVIGGKADILCLP